MRIKKKLSNIRIALFQPFFRRMCGWEDIQEQIDTVHYFLNSTVDIKSLPKANGVLRHLQLVDTEVLRIVTQILQKHGIDCWLDYGTLLGAVRHGGFIPWDDDLDVAVKRCDYKNAYELLKNELPKYGIEVGDCSLGRAWICIGDAGVICDIFPVDCVDSNSVETFESLSKKVFEYRKYYNNHQKDSEEKLILKREEIIGFPNYEKPVWYHNAEFNADGSVYANDTIFPLKTIIFEGYNFLPPKIVMNIYSRNTEKNIWIFPKREYCIIWVITISKYFTILLNLELIWMLYSIN